MTVKHRPLISRSWIEWHPNPYKSWWQFWKPNKWPTYVSEGPVFSKCEQAEFDRLLAGRSIYYVDDQGWPLPERKSDTHR